MGRNKNPKKVEFSKVILIAVSVLTVSVTVFTCAIVWRSGDTSPLSFLIPAVFAELATATGFYYSKAKAENRIKLRKKYGAEVYNDAKGETSYE